MGDFINDLKKDIRIAIPDISEDWAEFCAIAPLSTILHEARVIEKTAPLKLNLFMITIGPPGIGKSIPMLDWTKSIIQRTGDLINRDLLLPPRSSVEGFIKYVCGENCEEPNPPRNTGILIRDEFSGMFRGLRSKDWQSEGMEFLSEMYDGTFQKRYTTRHGLNLIDDLYASLITATTPYFTSELDKEFYIQGTGNRFLYSFHDIEEYNPEKTDPLDYFSEKWSFRNKKIDEYAKRLQKLYNKKIHRLIIHQEPGKLWSDYEYDCKKEWKEKLKKDPLGWDFHPIKRYPELALKLSGIYAISDKADKIIQYTDTRWEMEEHDLSIGEKHMKRAIDLLDRNQENFKNLVKMKMKYIPQKKPKSIEDMARLMARTIANSKEGILPWKEWRETQSISGNRNEIFQLRDICVRRGWVKEINQKEVPKKIRNRFEVYPSTKFYQYVG
jgi:hypothetical protein